VQIVDYDDERSRWGLGDFAACFLIFLVAGSAVALVFNSIGNTISGPWLPVLVALPPAAQLLYVWVIANRKGNGMVAEFQVRYGKGDLGHALWLLLGAVVSAGIAASLVRVVIGSTPTSAATDLGLDAADGRVSVWIALFALLGATFVPLVEEVLYRGLLWGALEKRGHSQKFTLAVTSVIFSMVHFEPQRLPILFVLGLALGYGRMRTGRLGSSIILHMLINSIAMIGLLSSI